MTAASILNMLYEIKKMLQFSSFFYFGSPLFLFDFSICSLTLSVPQAVKRGWQILTFCTPSRETRLANKRVECESTIGR